MSATMMNINGSVMKTDLVTFRGLPVTTLGVELREGLNCVPSFTDPVKRVTLSPGYVDVHNGVIVAYGSQPHLLIYI